MKLGRRLSETTAHGLAGFLLGCLVGCGLHICQTFSSCACRLHLRQLLVLILGLLLLDLVSSAEHLRQLLLQLLILRGVFWFFLVVRVGKKAETAA